MIHTATIAETSEARSLRRGTVLDVRTADEFAGGHIDGAVFMPLHIVPLRVSELDRSETYYVVCQSGGRSAQACAYLAAQGYDVRSIEGGMSAWRAAGHPVDTGLREPSSR
jgi:rhodanese-related sulfurtransferase